MAHGAAVNYETWSILFEGLREKAAKRFWESKMSPVVRMRLEEILNDYVLRQSFSQQVMWPAIRILAKKEPGDE